MTLTTAQIKSAIRRKILEESTDLVTDDTVYLNMNLAYDDIKFRTFTPDQVESATVTFTNGSGSLPANFGTLYGPAYQSATNKTPYAEKSIGEFDGEDAGPAMAVIGGALKVVPSTTASLIIRYYPSYPALDTIENPDVHPYFHELIIYGAIWRILEDLQDEARSAYYRSIYEAEFAKKSNSLSNYQEDNQGGNSLFNGIRII